MKIPTHNEIKQNQRFQYGAYLKKCYPEFFDFLLSEYITKYNITQSEALYWYFNDITEHPKCKTCGSAVQYKTFANGYRDFCSRSCLSKSNTQKILDKYGTTCTLTLPEVKEKTIQTFEKHYGKGVTHNWKAKEVQETCKNTCIELYGKNYLSQNQIKAKETCLKQYGNANYRNTDKIKQTFIEHYGVSSYTQTSEYWKKHNITCIKRYGTENPLSVIEIKNKILNSKRKNKSFNTSNIEKEFANYLTTNGIEFERQYKSEQYPFACDFYISKYDLYIEIQANWVHGRKPFVGSPEDNIKLNIWRNKNTKFYNNAIETWTKRDVLKRETAKKNKLNYLEIFSNKLSKVVDIFERQIKNV